MLTCFVVGNGAVALAACELLCGAGYNLLGVYSFDGSLAGFSEARGVPHLETKQALEAQLTAGGFDYLFSVNNPWIIPKAVIRAARAGVINFHDSPLPRYAGLHATSWALLHGETRHATTWHEVTEEIDAGRIYESVPFDILPHDTALSLNARVLELTLSSFETLIARLLAGDTRTTPQPDVPGSYFGLRDRPEAACTLDLTRGHRTLHDLVRALSFGHVRNPLGSAKLQLARDFYAQVTTLKNLGPARGTPGQVSRIGDGSLCVSAGDAELALEVVALTGEALSACALADVIGPGLCVPLASGAERAELSAYDRSLCAAENRWVERLLHVLPVRHPQLEAATCERRGLELPSLAEASREALLTAFAAYLVRVTRSECFDLGVVVDVPARLRPLFAELVPLRVAVGGAGGDEPLPLFAERLSREYALVQRDVGHARDLHTRVPALRELGGLPRFAVAFAAGDAHVPDEVELVLRWHGHDRAPSLTSTRMTSATLARVAHGIAACASTEPGVTLSGLDVLAPDDAARLAQWNDTARAFPDASTVHQLITSQCDRTPDRPAVSFAGTSWTYRELDRRSNQLAHALAAKGAGPGTLIGLCLPRSLELVVGLVAILKTGAAYVPIDPTYPEARVAHLREDSGIRTVLTTRALADRLFPGVVSLCVDEPTAASSERMPPRGTPDDPMYVIYTSGSTGKPKGAIVSHRSLVNHSTAIADKYGLDATSRMLQSASISFDVAAEQIYPVLLRGGCVVVRPDDLLESFSGFGAFARREAISAMILPTAFWHAWTAYMASAGESVPLALRTLSVGTEKALGGKLDLWQRLSEGRVRFFEGYGPTETTVTCTMFELQKGMRFGDERDVPIGRALPNVKLYVLDLYGRPAPIGVPGELYVGGVGVGMGYHARPELTRERFLPDPFAGAGARMYRTGDLVRFQDDGQLVFIGRIDAQLKIRGYRVELGEIEAELMACPDIEHAVVVAEDTGRGEPRLVGYFVPRAGTQPIADELRARLARSLPNYMVPEALGALERLPMTPNLKLDKRALPRLERANSSAAFVAPSTPEEARIAALWCDLFGLARVSVEDDFFALGGTSLLAIRMFTELDHAFRIRLPMSTVLSARSVRALAALVKAPEPRREGCLIQLRPGRGKHFFFVHDADGETLLYQNLARRLPDDYAVYGIEPRGRGRLSIVHTRVEDMAGHYVREVQRVQPHGPYQLGGLCAGGVLAFEMARQLEAQGEEVAVLALVESAPPGARRRTSENAERMGRLRALGQSLSLRTAFGVGRELLRKLHNGVRYELAQRVERARVAAQYRLLSRPFRDGIGWPARLPVPTTREVYASAERAYVPSVVRVREPVVFRALDGEGDERPFRHVYEDALFGWGALLAIEPQVVDVPGGHGGCLQEPHVEVIAHTLRRILARLPGDIAETVAPPAMAEESRRVA